MIGYDIVNSEIDERGSFFHQIKWIPPKESGFILQYVEVDDPNNLLPNYEKPYYEAWKVIDGKTEYENYDDSFSNGGEPDFKEYTIPGVQKKLKDDSNYIEFSAKVYWIGIDDPVYKEIEQWNHEVGMANELRSSYKAPKGTIHQVNSRRFRADFKKVDM